MAEAHPLPELPEGQNTIEHHLYLKLGYQWALGSFEMANILLLGFVVAIGTERKGRSFLREQPLVSA